MKIYKIGDIVYCHHILTIDDIDAGFKGRGKNIYKCKIIKRRIEKVEVEDEKDKGEIINDIGYTVRCLDKNVGYPFSEGIRYFNSSNVYESEKEFNKKMSQFLLHECVCEKCGNKHYHKKEKE